MKNDPEARERRGGVSLDRDTARRSRFFKGYWVKRLDCDRKAPVSMGENGICPRDFVIMEGVCHGRCKQ